MTINEETWEPELAIDEYVLLDYTQKRPLDSKTQEAIFVAGVNAVLELLDGHDQLSANGLLDARTLAQWKEFR